MSHAGFSGESACASPSSYPIAELKHRFSGITRLYPAKPTDNLRMHMFSRHLSLMYNAPEDYVLSGYFRPNSMLAGAMAAGWLAAKKLSPRDQRLFLGAFASYYPIYRKIMRSTKGVFIFDFHEDHSIQVVEFGGKFEDKKYEAYRDSMLGEADIVLLTGKKVAGIYERKGIRINNPLEVMCAADPQIIPCAPFPASPSVVCTHTIYDENSYRARGVDVLVKAMNLVVEEMPQASLKLVGCRNEGTKKIVLKDASPKLKLQMVGFVPHVDIWRHMAGASVCALPLKKTRGEFWNLGTGYKLFEYMASGRPLVCVEHEGYGEVIRDADCGVMYDGTSEDMAKKIVRLLEDTGLARRLGSDGRKAFVEKHTWRHRANTIAEAIEKL